MRFGLVLVAAAALVGCATTGATSGGGKSAEVDKLAKDCEARGGILVPIAGAHNGNEAANHACEFRGVSPKPAR